MKQAQPLTFDSDTYLAWEAKQMEKYEYLAGEDFAMARARREYWKKPRQSCVRENSCRGWKKIEYCTCCKC